jgi:hypothetical protein
MPWNPDAALIVYPPRIDFAAGVTQVRSLIDDAEKTLRHYEEEFANRIPTTANRQALHTALTNLKRNFEETLEFSPRFFVDEVENVKKRLDSAIEASNYYSEEEAAADDSRSNLNQKVSGIALYHFQNWVDN